MSEEVKQTNPNVLAALERARAARKANIEARKNGELPPVQKPQKQVSAASTESDVWLKGLLVAMEIREVKHPSDLNNCVVLADAVVEAYKKKFG